jgi:polyisoprenoid-binding protein YceI
MNRIALLLMLACAPVGAAEWTPVPGQSKLAFRGQASGEAFDGVFHRYTPKVRFDAAQPQSIAIEVDIDLASVDSRNAERDQTLVTDEFFALASNPLARFSASDCTLATPPNGYRCAGRLTLKGHSQDLEFRFTWVEGPDGSAALDATVALDRTDYEVGVGDWADADTIAHEVDVDVHLVLKPGA